MNRSNNILPLFLSFLLLLVFNTDLKSRDCYSSQIEKVDSCLVGINIQSAISKLDLSSSQYYVIEEPHGFIQGIEIDLPDYYIELRILPVSIQFKAIIGSREQYISDEEVFSVFWRSKSSGISKTIYK